MGMLGIVLVVMSVGMPDPASAALTDAEVLSKVQEVFPPLDGTQVSDTGGGGVAHLMPVLSRINGTGCPAFETPATWDHGPNLLRACLLAVLGNLANQEVTPGTHMTSIARRSC